MTLDVLALIARLAGTGLLLREMDRQRREADAEITRSPQFLHEEGWATSDCDLSDMDDEWPWSGDQM